MSIPGITKKFFISFLFFLSTSILAFKPQKLPVKEFYVCGKLLKLEMAESPQERNMGLMFRNAVPEGTGMLFVFEQEQPLRFWMKNVPMNIDIAYFDSKGRFINSHTMLGTSPLVKDQFLPGYPSLSPARYAVEVSEGFYSKVLQKKCQLRAKKGKLP